MSEEKNPWANSRKRLVVGSNGILQEALKGDLGKGCSAHLRKSFAKKAKATASEVKEGRSGVYTRSFSARKMLPTATLCDSVDSTWLTLHSYEPGSVAHLILSLHAIGFRLFSKSGLATSFLVNQALKEVDCTLKNEIKASDKALVTFNASDLFNALVTGVRGKGDDTTIEPLVKRFYPIFVGKPLTAKTKGPELEIISDLASALCDAFPTYNELNDHPLEALKSIQPSLSKLGINVDLTKAFDLLLDASKREGSLSKRTIVFDSELFERKFDRLADPASLMIALSARYAQEARLLEKNKITPYIQEAITTINANGMGWLLNKGRSLLPVTDDEEFETWLGVRKDHPAAKELIELLQGVNAPDLFRNDVVQQVRADVQGMIDSFTANHVARLTTSSEALNADIEEFVSNTKAALKSGGNELQGCSMLGDSLDQLPKTLENAHLAAQRLLGDTKQAITQDSVTDSIFVYTQSLSQINYVKGAVGTVNSAIKRGVITSSIIEIPKSWDGLIALPYINPAVVNVNEDRIKLKQDSEKLFEEFDLLVDGLQKEFSLSFENAMKNRCEFHKEFCRNTKRTALSESSVVAFRDLLSRLTSVANRGSYQLKQVVFDLLKSAKITDDITTLREHIYSRQHFVFVNPFDSKPKKLVPIISGKSIDLCHLIKEAITNESGLDLKDRLALKLTHASILLAGLPAEIPTRALKTETILKNGDRRYISLMEKQVIGRVEALSLLHSAYRSKLQGLSYRLNKEQFRVVRSLSPYIKNQLIYVPKERAWKIPQDMREGRFETIVSSDCMAWVDEHKIDVVETAKRLAKNKVLDVSDTIEFFRNMPHRFFISAELKGFGVDAFGVVINNGQIERSGQFSGLVPIAINRDNTFLLEAIHSLFDGGKVSPPTIQFDRSYKTDKKSGELIESLDQRKIVFQMPVTETTEAVEKAVWKPRYVLGIDPGNYGLGLALTDINGKNIDSGYLSVRSLISYVKKKNTHQTQTAPRQQYKAPYSDHLSKSAEAAIGDVCYVIDRLIAQFDAIPVFEIQSGKDDSANVWDKVISLYTWGDNDSQNSDRKAHFFGATHWETDLMRLAPQEKKPKPFVAYPGGKVGSYDNSNKCGCCKRSSLEAIKELMKSEDSIHMEGGVLNLPSGSISLQGPDPETARERKEKGLPPEWVQLGSRSFDTKKVNSVSSKDLLTAVRRSIRRSTAFKKETQGIASEFHCPYQDCNKIANSEANSGINIADKFVNQLS